ncbi:MAG: TIGR03016 family PEP-CTERM system-associated outer membrane protein [Methyloprofundus sp.]|nr:TIGR03016 family PEP-CTERM system-associated outer membrane protein [Methyloprofundus sp.]
MVPKNRALAITKSKVICLVSMSIFFTQEPVLAIDFKFAPSLTVQETYSDNIRLATKGNEQGAFVTEITPGLSIRSFNGGRVNANFDYRMQNLFNAGGEGDTQIFHQLNFNSGYEVSRNKLFVNARSSFNQQDTTNLRGGDNINNLETRTNIWTAGSSAIWTPHFGSFADAIVNIDFDYVGNDSAERLTNSMNLRESVLIRSGLAFSRVTWNIAFENSTEYRQNDDDVQFQSGNATLRSWLDRTFNVFTTLGYANNDFDSLDDDSNGFYYTVGAQWRPTWYFDIEAGYGSNWHVSSNISLSKRTRFNIGYFDRSIGLNTGGAWNASLNHYTRMSTWRFSYSEDTTSVQSILLEDTPFSIVGIDGNPILGNDGNPLIFNASVPTLTDDVLTRQTADFSVSYRTGKSNVQMGGFYEKRAYDQSDNNQETVYGVNASWNWEFIRRSSVLFSPSWQRIKRNNITATGFDLADIEDDRYQFTTRLTHVMPLTIGRSSVVNLSLEYSFLKQNSTLELNSYVENRVVASIFMSF